MRCVFVVLFISVSVFSQQLEIVDFIQLDAEIKPEFDTKSIYGKVICSFQILKDTDSIYLDAHGMKVFNNNHQTKIEATKDKIWFIDVFKKGKTYTVTFEYEVTPKQTFYFMLSEHEFWTQGQGKYTSHWLPSLDDTNDKLIFNLSYLVPENSTVIANGELKEKQKRGKDVLWRFEMQYPMPSYLVAVAGGNYKNKTFAAHSGTNVELYYKPEDEDKVEPTYRYSKELFDFLEEEIGVAYPWAVYKQVPVRDFLYAGMENTSATFFSEAFIVDSIGFNDRNYINVNAHELAHQWFGNMITAKSDEHHWLQEGFATYYALLAEKEVFGEDYFYWQLLQYAEQLHEMSEQGKGESVLNPKAGSLTFYQKGAWALHVLREKIGTENFRKAIRNYLNKYQFSIATTNDFLNEVALVYDGDLKSFEDNWLRQSAFRVEEAYQSLKKSDFILEYFKVSQLRDKPLYSKYKELEKALESSNDFIGQEAVYQLASENFSETADLYGKALRSKSLFVRQAVALTLQDVPQSLFENYSKLLTDESYLTQEAALYNLWISFPDRRMELLEKMQNRIGFQNKNIRQLWLALSIATDGYTKKEASLLELKSYTSPVHSFEIRQKAFEYIIELNLWDVETVRNLINGSQHPAWRFAKFSRDVLKQVVENRNSSSLIDKIKSEFTVSEREILEKYSGIN